MVDRLGNVQEIKILSYNQMVYAQTRICHKNVIRILILDFDIEIDHVNPAWIIHPVMINTHKKIFALLWTLLFRWATERKWKKGKKIDKYVDLVREL